ncbi:transposase [Micromonospora sp. NPDC006431]|uniref:transposase n=1 Tax=Micromonospora sp. NPDC006431 TaxID=3364235 RepID=UPI0036844940
MIREQVASARPGSSPLTASTSSVPAASAAASRRGITHTIPERADQQAGRRRRGSRSGRPPMFDRELYQRRNVVERCFNRLKQCRSVATRYDKTATSYQATITIAGLLQWM